jgi:two-component system response regulator AtoC
MSDDASMLVGTSAVMEEVRALVRQAAHSVEPVLLIGEVGTGKQLAARVIHSLSARSAAPFVPINCNGLPEHLLEHELFGREVFDCWGGTGVHYKPGRVALAEGGTLFLGDVAGLSPALQVKLLRLILEKQYEPYGGGKTLMADVRVMASSVRSLPEMVQAGTFREDLFARLSVRPIHLPPLRERAGDLPALVGHFLSKHRATNKHQNASITPGAVALLAGVTWFANVQDLESLIQVLLANAAPGDVVIDETAVQSEPPPDPLHVRLSRAQQLERKAVEEALQKAGGNRSVAARILGMSRRTLYNKLDGLGLP